MSSKGLRGREGRERTRKGKCQGGWQRVGGGDIKQLIRLMYPIVFFLRAAGSLIGEGMTNFITDWDKILATCV